MQALGLIETRGLLPAIECADVMLKTAQVELVERTFVGGGLVTITVTGDVGAVKAAVEAGVSAVEKLNHLSLVSRHIIPRPHPDIESMFSGRANPIMEQSISVTPVLEQSNSVAPVIEQSKGEDQVAEDAATVPATTEPTRTETTETTRSETTEITVPVPTEPNPTDSPAKLTNESREQVPTLPHEQASSLTSELAPEESTKPVQVQMNRYCKEELDALAKEFGLESCMEVLNTLPVVKLRNLAREYPEIALAGRAISKANKELLIQKLKKYYERGSEK